MEKKIKKNINSFYSWLVFFISSSFFLYKYLLQISPTVMTNELLHDLHLSGFNLGNIIGIYFYIYLIMQIPAGLLIDRYSPKWIMTISILICTIGMFIFSKAYSLFYIEVGRLLIGLGGSSAVVGTMKLISIWFSKNKFALISGIMMAFGMVGAITAEGPLSYMIKIYGWRKSSFFLSLIGLIIFVLFILIIKENFQKKKLLSKEQSNSYIVKGFIKILLNKESWLISCYSGFAFVPISVFGGFWSIPYLMHVYHINRVYIASLNSIIFIGFLISAPLGGWLSDYFQNRKNIMIVGTSMSFIFLSLIIYMFLPIWVLIFCLFFLGFFNGFFLVSFTMIKESNPIYLSATSIGFINMFNALCGAISGSMIGKLLDLSWNHIINNHTRIFLIHDYKIALSILPVFLLLGIICIFLSKETYQT